MNTEKQWPEEGHPEHCSLCAARCAELARTLTRIMCESCLESFGTVLPCQAHREP